MSVVFVVAPAVIASWPVLCGAIAGAAGILGYKTLNAANSLETVEPSDVSTEITLEGSEVIADSMKRETEFVIGKDDIKAVFSREADGRCSVHVSGTNRTLAELSAIGQELVGRVTQQYAYNRVVSEMKNLGFTVTDEQVSDDRTIRINVCKHI